MANNNFVVKNGLTVNGSFTANSTVVNASAITATSVNAVTLSISGVSVATLITSNAATAYTNAISYADTKSSAAYTNAVSLIGDATNITTGTLPNARLSSAIVNTSGSFTIGGLINFSSGVMFSNTITANGSNGTAGQVLTSSGPSGNVFWSSAASGVDTAARFSWTNAHIFSNTLTVNNSTLSVGNTTTNTSITLGTITLSNGATVSTVNATVYSGTANNAAALSGVSLATIQGQITSNAATAYSNAVANAAALYQTTAGLSANVATLTSNNSLYLGGTIASGYQTTAGLSANVATLTANNSTNFGGLSLTTVQGQITGNAATAYSNAIAYSAIATNLSSGTVPTARLASGTPSTSTYLRGDQTWATTGTVTSVGSGTGLTGGPVTGSGTISLATAGAGAATYSSGVSAITVDAYGRVTSVTGSAGYVTSSGVTSITAGGALSGGTITGTGTISLANLTASSASYTSGISAITVDAYGRVTSVTGSAGYTPVNSSVTFNAITGTGQIKGLSLVTTSGVVYLANDLQTYMNWDGTNIVFNKKTLCTSDVGTNGKFFGSGGGAAILAAGSTNVVYFSWNGSELVYDINNGAYSRAIYWFGASDQRLKTNISNTEVDSLSIVNSIGLKKFDWTDEGLKYNALQEKDKSVKIGVIAQELSQVIPEAVIKIKNEKEIETQLLKGEAIIPYLIGAIQEQQKQIADLQTQINLLKK